MFTLLALLLPVLFFVALEGGLRLVGYGDDYPLFIPVDGYSDYLYPSRDVARRYFSRQASIPSIPFDSFKREKDDATVRVFIQGGSSAAGYPFYFGGSFSDMLEQRLLQSYPGTKVEVVGTAMAAVNSYTLLDLADEIIEQQPDAVLIYAGHNEYYGALGAASAESIGRWRPTVLLYLRMKDLRTVQAMRGLISSMSGLFGGREAGQAPGTTMMARMVGEKSVPYASETFEAGIDQFRANLQDLLAIYREAGVPVFVGTVVSNVRDHQPFISGLSADTDPHTWRSEFEAAAGLAKSGDTTSAIRQFDELIAKDDLSGDAHFARAKLSEAVGDLQSARGHYYSAKDRDELRFRAPEAINEIIRDVAGKQGATVVDVQTAFEAVSRSGVTGDDLMTEHLHPNASGFFEIADAFYNALVESGLFEGSPRPITREVARSQLLFTELDSLIGTYRVSLLKGSWPFVPLGAPQVPIELEPKTLPESLAVQVLNSETSRLAALDRLRAHYLMRRDAPNALKASLASIQRYPFLAKPYLGAAGILVAQGALDQAMVYYTAANDRTETAEAHRMIGSILLRQQKRPESIRHLERSLRLEPDNPQALYNLSGAYAMEGKMDLARETVSRLLEVAPGHEAGQALGRRLNVER